MFGPDIEGLVIYNIGGEEYKITTNTFKADKAKTACELFVGRFQPFHNEHLQILNKMKNPVIAVVRGSVSSENKKKNPLSAEYQVQLIKKVAPGVPVFVVPNGFVPAIIQHVEDKLNWKVKTVHAGSDRLEQYKAQLQRAGVIGVDVVPTGTAREVSATDVRNSVLKGDESGFRKQVPPQIWSEFKKLGEYIKEDAEGGLGFNSTEGVAQPTKPIPARVLKRKKQEALEEFFQMLAEALKVPNKAKGFVKTRLEMPQVRDLDAFVADLEDEDVKIIKRKVDPEKLAPTQKEFSEEKVNHIVKKGNSPKPIIVSSDNYVIDGHHRWLAAAQMGKDNDALVVKMPAKEILAFLKGKKYVKHAHVNA